MNKARDDVALLFKVKTQSSARKNALFRCLDKFYYASHNKCAVQCEKR